MVEAIGRDTRLQIIRRAYAKQVLAAEGVSDRRVEKAFAAVRREDFLGRGPWPILRWGRGYVTSPSADPGYLYADVLVGIIPERHLNNGQPSFLARLIAAVAPVAGDHVVHIGAGVGYYTAILAHLAGRRGRVTAIEFEPALAARLAHNFAGTPNVDAVQGDGTQVEFAPADAILVNAGATRPLPRWLDRLRAGGRLILPLTTAAAFGGGGTVPFERRGAVFRIVRQGDDFSAARISGVGIYPCHGLRETAGERALAAAFERGGAERVTRLYRRDDIPERDCWLRGEGWCLAYR
ncbi:MAG: methyltransferase domain-containing protein [Alphaproteobacteria bacterium]|nr:methyltransferase domain-containing protein [Alphaproteobacteria bacterium]